MGEDQAVPTIASERRGTADERGTDGRHEAIRFWWHLDEMFVKINEERHYLRRAFDYEGDVLESFASKRRDRTATPTSRPPPVPASLGWLIDRMRDV
ncbi:hypothetical protein DDZ14_18685 [Maritimibacter sp. 55A14]|nr:hypothetical protein DDZ14_18685 [Maritimibacter sp. 55A14]